MNGVVSSMVGAVPSMVTALRCLVELLYNTQVGSGVDSHFSKQASSSKKAGGGKKGSIPRNWSVGPPDPCSRLGNIMKPGCVLVPRGEC